MTYPDVPDRRKKDGHPVDVWTQRFTAWGSMAVTFSIFALMTYDLFITAHLEDKQQFNGLNETIKAMAMIAVGFWLGSSNAKQRQDEALVDTAKAQSQTTSAAITALSTGTPTSTKIINEPGPPASTTIETGPGEPEEGKEAGRPVG